MGRASLLPCLLTGFAILAAGMVRAEDPTTADRLARQAEAHRAEGKLEQSFNELLRARALAEKSGDPGLLSAIDAALADVGSAGEFDGRAREGWARALDRLLAEIGPGQERTRAAALNTLGRLRDTPDSVDAFRQSAVLARR
ncbi:hypothetical protein [Azospirillum argentinense]|uniref:hypothetical protein n=1 Tax=Azospirillum argentinense TaxID=2970906 RepID=UPI00190EADA3|nr:hypothetical protein [Azospirillum argentinense]